MGEKVATARRRGGRLAGLVVVCLIAGFVAQTLVAFGIARFGPTSMGVLNARELAIVACVKQGSGYVYIFAGSHRGVRLFAAKARPANSYGDPPLHGSAPSWIVLPPSGNEDFWATLGFGWPLPCWRGHYSFWGGSGPRVPQPSGSQGLPGFDRHKLFDVRPIPLNTLANSAFYGVIVAGVWLIARTARRRWRSRFRPGTCTHCGYALAGLPAAAPCPECGRER